MHRLTRISTALTVAAALSGAQIVHAEPYTELSKAPAGTYTLDKTHGYVTFTYMHQGYSRPYLRFRDIDATLELKPKKLSASSVSVEIDAASIDSGVDVFDEHLKGDKHFDVAQYPKITFKSTAFTPNDDGSYTLTGDLTMKGVTKAVSLNTQFNKGGEHFMKKFPVIGFSAKGSVKRSDWGLGYAVPMVGDDVDIIIETEFWQEGQ